MSGYGRFSHGPRRWGRAARSSTETILKGLLADFGTGFDPSDDLAVANVSWIEANAWARALDSAWSQTRRLRNQFDPTRMSDFLPRWEAILKIVPLPTDSLSDRRNEVARRFLFLGLSARRQSLFDLLTEILPDLAPAIVNTSSIDATTHVTNGANIPGGINVPADGIWSSTIAYLAILLTRPTWMTSPALDVEFFAEAGRINKYLDDFLPAWTTFSFVSDAHVFPTSADSGFFLDEPDLDEERLGFVTDGPTIGGAAWVQAIFPVTLSKNVSGNTTYANYYGFTVGSTESVTATVTRGAPGGLYLAFISGKTRDGAVLTFGVTGGTSKTINATLAAGSYVLEVNSNSADVIDGKTSPFTATIILSTP